MLNNLITKKKLTFLGLNSGTSADALDMAAVEINRQRNGYAVTFIKGKEKTYPRDLRNAILDLADNKISDINKMVYLNNALGKFIGQQTKIFIRSLKKQNIIINAIASHGQTVRHLPKKVNRFGYNVNGTLQIGSSDFIALETGLPVISDFRQADIAVGNEGAPITTSALAKIFSSTKESKLIINIGGMSNYFYFPKGNKVNNIAAEDCGPGNVLSDLLCQKLFNLPFDKNGSIAQKGLVSERLMTLLFSDNFYKAKEKSTGRESFGEETVNTMLSFADQFELKKEDLVATAVESACRSILLKANEIQKKDKKLRKLYLTGGGRKNIFLKKRLALLLPDMQVVLVDELGISGDYIEAVSFAVLGEALLRQERIHNVSGHKGMKPLLGKLTFPPK